MSNYSTENIHNIALVGHGGSGKTTLMESMLFKTGVINGMGSVEKGNTFSDFDPQEKIHHHSLESALASLDYDGGHINIIDTPGYPDFIGRALSVLPAVETCAVVINAQNGIEMVTQKMMQVANERNLDRLIIINKIDSEDINLESLLNDLRETFGKECLPLNLPAENGKKIVDCYFQNDGSETDFSSVSEAHTKIVDQVVELDDELMELYLDGQEIKPDQIHEPFEKALREGHLIPVCFVSASTDVGIDELLNIFSHLTPNPLEANPPHYFKKNGAAPEDYTIDPLNNDHAVAHVFKVGIDPFVGKMSLFRVHQGRLTKETQLFVDDARKAFKIGHLFKVQGKQTVETDEGIAGDICAVTKIDQVGFDAVLHDSHEEDDLHLDSIEIPEPMYGLAIETKSRGDEQKISDALKKLEQEDQSFRVEHNPNTNETVIRGLGEYHLRIILEKLRVRYHIEVDTKTPKIAYRETITKKAEGHYRHKKQTGGAGQFGEVYLRIEPLQRGAGFEFVDAVAGGVIPRSLIPAVEKGIRQAVAQGAIAGHPLNDIKVTVYDGKHHSVDSKEIAFVAAGKKAFLEAVKNAKPVVLEPIVHIEITIPSSSMGDITADLSGKRGRISETGAIAGGMTLVQAVVPLSELDSYQSELKSMTGGNGTYSISFSHYDAISSKTQKELVAAYHPGEDED